MFWFGIGLTLVSGLLSISPGALQRCVPITERQLKRCQLILLLLGAGIMILTHLQDQRQIDESVGYQEIATYNANGNKTGAIMGVRMVPSPIDDWDIAFVSRPGGKLVWRCGPEAIAACRAVIKKLPKYPFSYYFLALCLKENGDGAWRREAKKAKSILDRSTTLPGHDPDHELVLREIEVLLR